MERPFPSHNLKTMPRLYNGLRFEPIMTETGACEPKRTDTANPLDRTSSDEYGMWIASKASPTSLASGPDPLTKMSNIICRSPVACTASELRRQLAFTKALAIFIARNEASGSLGTYLINTSEGAFASTAENVS